MTSSATKAGSLLLVRHGQTAYSAAGRRTGLVDEPLDAEGERQARALAPELGAHEFDQVWCSPLQRAQQTAALGGLSSPRLEPQLVEWDYGGYDGLTDAQISDRLGRPWSLWDDGVVPGDTPGESLQQVRARCDDVLARLLPLVQGGGRAAVVAHGHQLRVLATAWLRVAPGQAALLALGPASLSVLGHEEGRRALTLWNAAPGHVAL